MRLAASGAKPAARRHMASPLRRFRVIFKMRLARFGNIAANNRAIRGVHNIFVGGASLVASLFRGAARLFTVAAGRLSDRLNAYREPAADAVGKTYEWLGQFRAGLGNLALRLSDRTRSRFAPAILLCCATVCIVAASYFGIGLEVRLDGKSLGFVNSRTEMEEIISEVENQTSGYLNTPYTLNLDISYSLGYIRRDNMLQPEAVKDLLFSTINEISTQYALTVDGKVVAANESRTALELMVQRILQAYSEGGQVKTEFVQDVKIEQLPVSKAQLKDVDQIEQMLSQNKQEVVTYTVKSGDTVSQIAADHSLSLAEIQALNPSLNVANIHVGDQIQLSAAVPLLSIKQTKQLSYTAAVPYETKTEQTDSLYKNQTRVIQKGVEGTANVVADVVYVDGVEQGRTVLSYEVVTPPVTQIKQVGTKTPPAKAAKGYFIIPFNGIRTSFYGYRSRGDFHTGVDFAGPKGSPVVASDGGTVTFAGWNGGYGRCVMIDHGNGFVTLYAHNSQLLVKKGQKVAQGERIAKIGSTGNSTGPHCHFEIRRNGKTVNPLNYLK